MSEPSTRRWFETFKSLRTAGLPLDRVPKEVKQSRMTACQACDKYKEATKQCGICGCFMPIKTGLIWDPVESLKKLKATRTTCPDKQPKWTEFINP